MKQSGYDPKKARTYEVVIVSDVITLKSETSNFNVLGLPVDAAHARSVSYTVHVHVYGALSISHNVLQIATWTKGVLYWPRAYIERKGMQFAMDLAHK